MSISLFKETQVREINPSLIQQMEDIVTEVIVDSKFHSDFYINDMKSMESCNTFAWYVYYCGTHFIPLNDMSAVLEFQSEWINKLNDLNDCKKAQKTDRLYVCNTSVGELKRIYYFDEGNLVEQVQSAI